MAKVSAKANGSPAIKRVEERKARAKARTLYMRSTSWELGEVNNSGPMNNPGATTSGEATVVGTQTKDLDISDLLHH